MVIPLVGSMGSSKPSSWYPSKLGNWLRTHTSLCALMGGFVKLRNETLRIEIAEVFSLLDILKKA